MILRGDTTSNEDGDQAVERASRSQRFGIYVSTSSAGGVGTCGEALVGFHEDAISQAAVGRAQVMLALILGLGLGAECSEFVILGFILPAAELHLCVDGHRKGWLVSITLLALTFGSIVWGILGDRIGRRRAVLSALSVAALFSAVATFMPTYGTFMTARFCSGFGVAGAVPLAFSYVAETCPRATRTRYMGLLHSYWPLGALMTSMLAHLILPKDGAEAVIDHKEHWSSWHKFLILNMLPTVACVLGLLWTSESPRYLLEASREVEALEVYQRLHRLNKESTRYGLTELELPGRSAYREPASPSRNVFSHGLEAFREAMQRVSSPTHFRITMILAGLHFILGFGYNGISSFSTALIREMNDQEYYSSTTQISNFNFTDSLFNTTIENVQYNESMFKNTTFRHLNLNHVKFLNCVFEDVEFTNVKSSISTFENCTIKNCRFIDTDLENHHFINCNLANNTFLSLMSDCSIDFDYNIYLEYLFIETNCWGLPMVVCLLIIGIVLEATRRPPVMIVLLSIASLTGIGIFFLVNIMSVLIVETILKVLLMCAVHVVTMVVIEAYPCHLRCTAHGIMRGIFHLGCLCSIPIYSGLQHMPLAVAAIITIHTTVSAAILSSRVQDNSKVLL